MSATACVLPAVSPRLTEAQLAAINAATGLIAPVWPLDQTIAVNPYWQLRHLPRQQVAARMAALAGSPSLMSPDFYRDAWHSGLIKDSDLRKASAQSAPTATLALTPAVLLAELQHTGRAPAVWRKLSDVLDTRRSPRQMSWQEEIVYQISQFCAAHFQQHRPLLTRSGTDNEAGLYPHWHHNVAQDHGISVLMSVPSLTRQFQLLPAQADQLLAMAISELGIADEHLELVCHGLLLDVNGWASHLAWRAWHRSDEHNNLETRDLLAIRMAWELVLWRLAPADLQQVWQQETSSLPGLLNQHEEAQSALWIWARALEIAEQRHLRERLLQGLPAAVSLEYASPPDARKRLQAVFCIDVRSEPMRRALENQGADVETFGFAGFFGLPIACQPDATSVCRPQLPGLLSAQLTATPSGATHSLERVQQQAHWQDWSESASGTFAMVESAGGAYLMNLLRQTFRPQAAENPVSALTHQTQWQLSKDGQVLDAQALAALVKPVLIAMGVQHWAPVVLLVGHGSHSANNLQAAGLDCGACGGQTGEVNVRVLAQLLNNVEVRAQLTVLDYPLPADTQFVAALHNTTTDHIDCFDASVAAQLNPVLTSARAQAQRARATAFAELQGLLSSEKLDQAFQKRSNDWSQPRPEWGLANNKAFVIAPRVWTRNSDLQGRVFLHDYCWQDDAGRQFSVLELLMTAPMIVTHWINMQYNASMTDNYKFGSGNKLLHNAVGGNLGVFEGNAGDLRFGLARQSLHNGERWMHTPVRLAVYIAAPATAIAEIVARHVMLQDLINNGWIELYQWQADQGFARLNQGRWQLVKFGPGELR